MQVFQGQPLFIRRPLPNKGRYFPKPDLFQWFACASADWLNQIWDNNSQAVRPLLNPACFSHFDEVEDNNPEA